MLKTHFDRSSLFCDATDALPGCEELIIQETGYPHIVTLSGRFKRQKLRTTIEVVPCPFGNSRFYFICPLTNLRVTTLYLGKQGEYMSRFALNAVYRVQKEHRGPYYLLSRSRDLKKKSALISDQGKTERAEKLLKMAELLQKEFYSAKLLYFGNRIDRLRDRCDIN